ncbi:MmcQ/YjbR family DNA-binding protein [Terrabacter terrigena]|uniref:MmcQ/YjbR family DNA-binding protein n=1 Tax=Terrabacter terrigena TaxID=574718 RepID=A0ABW3MVY2_9MICO
MAPRGGDVEQDTTLAGRLRAAALALPGAWEDSPWEGDTVAKVADKIFVFLGEESIGVKSAGNRLEADEWLHRYPDDVSVLAYIGRHGWNSLRLGGAIDEDELLEAVETSYEIVVAGLPRTRRPE